MHALLLFLALPPGLDAIGPAPERIYQETDCAAFDVLAGVVPDLAGCTGVILAPGQAAWLSDMTLRGEAIEQAYILDWTAWQVREEMYQERLKEDKRMRLGFAAGVGLGALAAIGAVLLVGQLNGN